MSVSSPEMLLKEHIDATMPQELTSPLGKEHIDFAGQQVGLDHAITSRLFSNMVFPIRKLSGSPEYELVEHEEFGIKIARRAVVGLPYPPEGTVPSRTDVPTTGSRIHGKNPSFTFDAAITAHDLDIFTNRIPTFKQVRGYSSPESQDNLRRINNFVLSGIYENIKTRWERLIPTT
jgi:hypothetical protein